MSTHKLCLLKFALNIGFVFRIAEQMGLSSAALAKSLINLANAGLASVRLLPLRNRARRHIKSIHRTTPVNGFDQCEAAQAIRPIADRTGVAFDGTDEILEYRLMRPMVADDRRR